MDLFELTQGVDEKVVKQIEYVYAVFCKEFPDTLYDNRDQIVGIGEPNQYLFCYFKRQEGKVFAKFKSERIAIELPNEFELLETCIKRTIDLFNGKEVKPRDRRGRLSSTKRAERHFPELYFCDDLEKVKKEISQNQEFFAQMTIELKRLLTELVHQTFLGEKAERDKDICLSLLEQEKKRLSYRKLQERHGISRTTIRRIFIMRFNRLARSMFFHTEEGDRIFDLTNGYLEKFLNKNVSAFMIYLNLSGYKYMLRAFIVFILRKRRYFIETENSVYSACKQIKSKPKMVNYNGFKVYVDADGGFLTDLELLDKLKEQRKKIASEFGVDEKWVYKNAQLVLLATKKPIDKQSYSLAIGSDASWEECGIKMVEIIKNK